MFVFSSSKMIKLYPIGKTSNRNTRYYTPNKLKQNRCAKEKKVIFLSFRFSFTRKTIKAALCEIVKENN